MIVVLVVGGASIEAAAVGSDGLVVVRRVVCIAVLVPIAVIVDVSIVTLQPRSQNDNAEAAKPTPSRQSRKAEATNSKTRIPEAQAPKPKPRRPSREGPAAKLQSQIRSRGTESSPLLLFANSQPRLQGFGVAPSPSRLRLRGFGITAPA